MLVRSWGTAAPKGYHAGTHRVVPPEVTVARVERLMPVLGITRVAHVTGLDVLGIPVVMVCRPNSKSLSVSQGKGVTGPAAVASGLMESLELYHAERVEAPLRLGSWNQLRHRIPLADVDRLPRLAQGPFHGDLRLLWCEATDLGSGEPQWVPFEMIDLDCTRPALPGAGSFLASSNGLASGNDPWEATLHALCEVIERDALSRFLRADRSARNGRRVRLDAVREDVIAGLRQRIGNAGLRVAIWDITSPAGVPAFRCALADGAGPPAPRGVSYGMGCHPDRAVALSRAITEAAQVRLTAIAGARDDLARAHYQGVTSPDRLTEEQEALFTPPPERFLEEAPAWTSADLAADVGWVRERLHAAGHDTVLLADLTHPALGIPVVRVVIPGMEGVTGLGQGVPEVAA